MREVENLPFGPTARWSSLNLVGSFDGPPPLASNKKKPAYVTKKPALQPT